MTRRLSGYIQGGHENRKAIAGALRSVYRADNAEAGLAVLEAFEAGPWGQIVRPLRKPSADTGTR